MNEVHLRIKYFKCKTSLLERDESKSSMKYRKAEEVIYLLP